MAVWEHIPVQKEGLKSEGEDGKRRRLRGGLEGVGGRGWEGCGGQRQDCARTELRFCTTVLLGFEVLISIMKRDH